jgi:NADPH-dependent 2,4-dienoyl-CoA reductase/sulfur reductase-like enzyme
MERFDYVIVGGGMAAHAAAQGIREVDAKGRIALFGAEPHRPYARPPLSKKLWTGAEEESVWLPAVEGLDLRLGRPIVRIDRAAHEVEDGTGERHGYGKLLLATGGSTRQLPWKDDRIIHYRTLGHFRRVREALAEGRRRIVVVGGGFIGSEMAAALAQNGAAVTMVFPEPGVCARAFPADLSGFVTGYYRDRGVTVWAGELVASIDASPAGLTVRTKTGKETVADLVVAGVGITPSVDLARDAGLAVGDGVDVDATLRTSDPDIFAAGDVARFESRALGKRVRVEHEDNALTMGKVAGQAMAGADVTYTHLPFFYSDLFDLGYEAVGEIDAHHQAVADWKKPFREGVVYFLDGGRVRGVLLWNTWGQVDAARALIESRGPVRAETLHGIIA